MKDRFLLCLDCGDLFRFSVVERKYYRQIRTYHFGESCDLISARKVTDVEITLENREFTVFARQVRICLRKKSKIIKRDPGSHTEKLY